MRLTAVCFAALALTAATAAPASAFEPIEGVWRTETSTAGEYLIQQASPVKLGGRILYRYEYPATPCSL